jgi:hypothetical protein
MATRGGGGCLAAFGFFGSRLLLLLPFAKVIPFPVAPIL